ncbi:hypothetical protein PG997_003351 [Apiospora hydei]|uniref:EF-hand domain-containing protein n=1 Tax=Apiospora hydei TaxID=1337664 RepID=A0ABR1WZ25_9PEZI
MAALTPRAVPLGLATSSAATVTGRSLAADPFASKPVEEAFALADTAGNGKVTLPQYLAYMRVPEEDDSAKAVWAAWFNK